MLKKEYSNGRMAIRAVHVLFEIDKHIKNLLIAITLLCLVVGLVYPQTRTQKCLEHHYHPEHFESIENNGYKECIVDNYGNDVWWSEYASGTTRLLRIGNKGIFIYMERCCEGSSVVIAAYVSAGKLVTTTYIDDEDKYIDAVCFWEEVRTSIRNNNYMDHTSVDRYVQALSRDQGSKYNIGHPHLIGE